MAAAASAPCVVSAVSVVIPAYNEQPRVAATVAAARAIPGVCEVIVVDDGSRDRTAEEATQAGARVIRAPHRGKAAALRRGINAAAGEFVLLLDADLGESATAAQVLLEPVLARRADLSIAHLPAPRQRPGFGLALTTARICLWVLTGRVFAAPLSGQRCLSTALARTLPWGRGFQAEVAATADAAALGARIIEVPASLEHSATGRTIAGWVHRGRQLGAVLAACVPRALYPIGPSARPAPPRRQVVACAAWAGLAALGFVGHPWALAAVGLAAFAVFCAAFSALVNQAGGLYRANYRGVEIPAALGLAFPLGPLGAWCAAAVAGAPVSLVLLLALTDLAAAVTALVGFADDIWGSREVSGLRGHLACLARGRVTTGALKAMVGAAVGLGVGWALESGNAWLALLDGVVIALSANFVNLLDVRPGRALKGFLLLVAAAALAGPRALYVAGPMAVAALGAAPLDFAGRAMMGDVGSNALGAVVGIALVDALPVWGRLVLAAALAGIHVYSERRSLSDLIVRVRALRWLDRLGCAVEDYP